MPTGPRFFVRLNGEPHGPFATEQLRELADVGVVTPQTEAALDAAGPWTTLCALPESAGIFPDRRQFQFKARVFESVNRSDTPPVDHRELIAAAQRGGNAPAATRPAAPPPGDPLQIVRENTRVQLLHEKPVDLTPPPNRRQRDYLILMTAVNGCFVVTMVLSGVSVFAVSGIVLTSVSLTWVMFGVMSRY